MGGFYGRFRKRRRIGKPEKKFYDINLALDPIATSGGFAAVVADGPVAFTSSLNDILQGAGEQQRIGRKCTIVNIYCRFVFSFLGTLLGSNAENMAEADKAHETIRVIIYWDKQCNGAAISSAELLETDVYSAFRNLANIKRFRILHDKLYTFNTTAIVSGDGTAATDTKVVGKDWHINISKKIFIPIEFAAALGALTEIRSNNIGIIFWGKHGGRVELSDASKIRLRFIDY